MKYLMGILATIATLAALAAAWTNGDTRISWISTAVILYFSAVICGLVLEGI